MTTDDEENRKAPTVSCPTCKATERAQSDTLGEIDPSTELTKRKYTKSGKYKNPMVGPKCSAKSSRTGKPCEKYPVAGANVCRVHGGASAQVQRAARIRLEMAADKLAQRLLKFALDGHVPDTVALTAIRDALDRARLSVKTSVDVGFSVKPFQAILESLDSGSRADFRRLKGIEDPEVPEEPQPALDALSADDDDDLIVEGEVLDAEDLIYNGDSQPITPDDDERGSHDGSAPFCGPDGQPWADENPGPFGGPLGANGPAGSGMMPLTEAVAAQAEMRKHATLRPITRALPRGRS